MSLQYKVPENIDIEDKVIGQLTLKQFMYLFGAFAITMLLYQIIKPSNLFLFSMIVFPIWALAGMLGFLKPDGRSMDAIIIYGIMFLTRPKRRIWQRETENIMDIITKNKPKEEILQKKQIPDKDQLEILAKLIDTSSSTQLSSITVDILEDTPEKKEGFLKIIEKIKPQKKEEPLISELSTVSPDKKFNYDYQNIPLADSEILDMAKGHKQNPH